MILESKLIKSVTASTFSPSICNDMMELKRLLMKVKEESEKVALKLNIQKMKIMASGPITSWKIDRETMETVTDFLSWAP